MHFDIQLQNSLISWFFPQTVIYSQRNRKKDKLRDVKKG